MKLDAQSCWGLLLSGCVVMANDGLPASGGFRCPVVTSKKRRASVIVHHPLAPRALAAPLHYHHNEDEFSFVLSGTLGALLGEEVVIATAGTWLRKPRRQWHTFWNADEVPCEIIDERQRCATRISFI